MPPVNPPHDGIADRFGDDGGSFCHPRSTGAGTVGLRRVRASYVHYARV